MSKVFKKLGLILTLFAAVLMMTGCPGPQTAGEDTCTVTFYAEKNSTGIAVTVAKGDTLRSIESSIPVASIEGFDSVDDFAAWVTAEGVTFPYDKPIVNDISLYAKFKKVVIHTETHEEAETEITDGSSGTSTTDTTTLPDGTEITQTTETVTNPEGETTTIETVTSEDTEGNTTTTETVTDSDGTTTVTETVTDTEGNTTITETVTDSEGNTTTEITTPDTITVKKLVELGLDALAKGNISAAKSYFNAAYEKDPTDDEALLYSALSDLTSILTNSEIQKFFENHIGIMNYPSTLDGLLSGNWLRSDGYTVQGKGRIWAGKLTEVKNPEFDEYYYYRAKETYKDSSELNVYSYYSDNCLIEIDGKKYISNLRGKNSYESLKNGKINYMFGGHSSYGYTSVYYPSYVELDNNGDFLIQVSANKVSDEFTAYDIEYYDDVSFTYPLTYIGPEFNTLDDQSWFAGTVRDSNFLSKLVVANILNGNTNGLNSAIDDLYSAVYESKEYKSVCNKIAAIKTGVAIPALVIDEFDLEKTFGTDTVIIGPTELTLIKDVINWYKGLLEYLQSYSFSYDLSIFKEHWADLAAETDKTDPNAEPPYAFLLEAVSSYNASLDPIANGFLSVRNPAKVTASKNTFLGIFTDVIAAYDNIMADDSAYPAVIKGFLGDYAEIRDFAVGIKEAIEAGTKFDFPIKGEPAYIDFGKFFTSGQFALENIIEIEAVAGAKAAKVPVFYALDHKTDLVVKKITNANEFAEAFEAGYDFALNFKAFESISEVTDAVSIMMAGKDAYYKYMTLPNEAAILVFNFYYGGLEELLAPQNAD